MDTSLADDLLDGAAEIAEYLFGDRKQRRRVYGLYPVRLTPA